MPQQMLVHKCDKIKNWGGKCRDVTPTKLQSQNIFKESTGGGERSEVFAKIKKKNCVGGGFRLGGQGGCE